MGSVVVGAAGRLGRELCSRLPGQVHAFTHAQIDLTKPDTLAPLHRLRSGFVFNCAAYDHVDQAEADREVAFAVNAHGVRNLAVVCRDLDCTLVHFSTDYVFGQDHLRRNPYTEIDAPGPINVYGASKLAGEREVHLQCPRHLLIRTCGLYGPPNPSGKGRDFVHTMLHLAAQGKPIRVVNDQTCTPTYVADLADAVVALVQNEVRGLCHVTNAGACTWFEFAQAIFDIAGIDADLQPITSADYPAAARRPAYSVLASTRSDLPPAARLRPWREALTAFLSGTEA
jgi:dTDP-4-dehydrorhamnose reductase